MPPLPSFFLDEYAMLSEVKDWLLFRVKSIGDRWTPLILDVISHSADSVHTLLLQLYSRRQLLASFSTQKSCVLTWAGYDRVCRIWDGEPCLYRLLLLSVVFIVIPCINLEAVKYLARGFKAFDHLRYRGWPKKKKRLLRCEFGLRCVTPQFLHAVCR